MKALVCEMCGSADIEKQDGRFVCQHCGTKYSVEEAKKMMGIVSVDASGSTVKIDASDELKNLYQIARRAKDDNNSANASKYYDLILVKDPSSWEAAFYVVYFNAMQCKIAGIESAAISVSNCLDSVFLLVEKNVSDIAEKAAIVKEIEMRCSKIANMLFNAAKNHYEDTDSSIRSNYTQEVVDRGVASRDIMYICGNYIDSIWNGMGEMGALAVKAWKKGIELHTKLLPYLANPALNKEKMISYAKKIEKYDASYAHSYIRSVKKEELAVLESELRKVENEKVVGKGTLLFTAIFMTACACLMLYLESFVLGGIFLFLGIIYFIVAFATKGQKKENKAHQERVAAAQAKVNAKKAEIEAIGK